MGTATLKELFADSESAAAVAKGLGSDGTYAVEGGLVALDALTSLPASPPFVDALKALQDGEASALEQARLARAFSISGQPKRAAIASAPRQRYRVR